MRSAPLVKVSEIADLSRVRVGIHVLVGSNKLRGPQRVRAWLPSLVHHCFLDDARTQRVMAEPNEKNEKMLQVSLLLPLPGTQLSSCAATREMSPANTRPRAAVLRVRRIRPPRQRRVPSQDGCAHGLRARQLLRQVPVLIASRVRTSPRSLGSDAVHREPHPFTPQYHTPNFSPRMFCSSF